VRIGWCISNRDGPLCQTTHALDDRARTRGFKIRNRVNSFVVFFLWNDIYNENRLKRCALPIYIYIYIYSLQII